MLARFLQELQRLAGADALRKRYLVAVSGGADSTVAATLFHEAGLHFAMAHCNFHLRGADSDRDMRFVQEMGLTVRLLIIQEPKREPILIFMQACGSMGKCLSSRLLMSAKK